MSTVSDIVTLYTLLARLEATGAPAAEVAGCRAVLSLALCAAAGPAAAPVRAEELDPPEEPPAAAGEAAAAPAAAPAAPPHNPGQNFASDDFNRMCREGVFPDGTRLFLRCGRGAAAEVYKAQVRLTFLPGGAMEGHIVSAADPDFYNWAGGVFTSPTGFCKAQAKHITPRHPAPTAPGSGWDWVRIGSADGPLLKVARKLWRERNAMDAAAWVEEHMGP